MTLKLFCGLSYAPYDAVLKKNTTQRQLKQSHCGRHFLFRDGSNGDSISTGPLLWKAHAMSWLSSVFFQDECTRDMLKTVQKELHTEAQCKIYQKY